MKDSIAHAGNVVKTPMGGLVAIDVMMDQSDPDELRRFGWDMVSSPSS